VLLGVAVFTVSVGVNVHMAMNVNFIDAVLAATPFQQGYLESIRETCGILSFLAVALLAGRSEPRIAAVMVLLVGGGLASYSGISSIPQLIALSLVWSFGLHVWMPVSRSMQLALARAGREGSIQGRYRSVGAAGVLLALGLVYLLRTVAGLGMKQLFFIAGLTTAVGAIPLFLMPAMRSRRSERMPLRRITRKGYRLFCGLELLDGMRKQIFLLFAVLTLVRERGTPVEIIALLMFANQVLCLLLAPIAGYLVDRFGERPVLSFYFAGVGALFLAYTSVTSTYALFAIFVIDNALFVFKVGLPTYAGRIAAKGERTGLLAMGVTMNHVGAVTLPLAGGALYSAFGYRVPFYCGAAVALISLIITQTMTSRTETEGAPDMDRIRADRSTRIRFAALSGALAILSFACYSTYRMSDGPVIVQALDAVPAAEGPASLRRNGAHVVLRLAGSPAEMGRQHGTLLRMNVGLTVEQYVLDRVIRSRDVGAERRVELAGAARELREHLPPRFVEELDACSAAAGVDADLLLLAQCEGDLRQAVETRASDHACSAYVVLGDASRGVAFEAGRNFDYYMGRDVPHTCALVTYYEPDRGNAFTAIGVAGVITGPTLINEHGLIIANHLWSNSDAATDPEGVPTWILMRMVAERAATVEEAVGVLRSSRRMRNQIIWLAQMADATSGRPARAAAVYYDADSLEVDEAKDGVLVVTNVDYGIGCSRRERIRRALTRRAADVEEPATREVAGLYTFHMVHVLPERGVFKVWHGATPAQRGVHEEYVMPGRKPKRPAVADE